MYLDVNVNNIGENHTAKKDPTADIKQFYSDLFSMDGHGKKKRRHCNFCRFVYYDIHVFTILSHLLQEMQRLLAEWPW